MGGKFVSQVLTLAGGTAFAQVVNIVSLPALTRLYRPEDFGLQAIFLAVVTLGLVLVSLKYENAIMAARTDGEARRCVALVFWLSSALSAVIAIMSLLASLLPLELPDEFLVVALCSAIMMASSSCMQALYIFGNRISHYGYLTRGRVLGALATGGFAIAYGLYPGGYEGLLIATIIGSLVNTIYLWRRSEQLSLVFLARSRRYLVAVAQANIRFPKFLILSSLLDRASAQFHIFVLAHWFGPAVSGSVSLHNRVVSLPSSIVGGAIGDVFKQKASVALRTHGECASLFIRSAIALSLVVVGPFVILLFFAPELFILVFGSEWRMAGEISQRLAVVFALGFVVSPLSSLIYLEDNQKYDLIVQGILMVSLISGFSWAVLRGEVMTAINVYALAFCVKYLIEFYLCGCIATGRSWKLQKIVVS